MEPLLDIKETNSLWSESESVIRRIKTEDTIQESENTFRPKPSKKIKIFLVDDDLVFLSALKNLIAGIDDHVAVTTFETGEDCIKNLSANPSIVILDYYLDNQFYDAMNGMKVLRRIKQLNPDTNVIMLSGQSNINVALDAIKYKAYDYVLKNDDAFIKTKNIVQHILLGIQTTEDADNKIGTYRRVNIVIVVVLILLFLLSRSL